LADGCIVIDNRPGDELNAQDEIRLLGVDVERQMDRNGRKFTNQNRPTLNANGCKIKGSVSLRSEFSGGAVSLVGADVEGQLDCNGGKFANQKGTALVADGAKLNGSVFFCDGFRAEGEVRLLGANVTGDLSFVGGKFANKHGPALNADGCKVSVLLRDKFNAKGEVRLPGAENRKTAGLQRREVRC
jgi:hypothetical protein